jgi:hypothetical protein
MNNNIYGPGDDDYGRNPRKLTPGSQEWMDALVESRNKVEIITVPEALYPLTPKEARPYSAKVERFIEWVAARAYKDIRGKYRVYQMSIKHTLNSLDELYEWWDSNIENK